MEIDPFKEARPLTANSKANNPRYRKTIKKALYIFKKNSDPRTFFLVSPFTVSGYALAQFGIAYSLIAQFGLYIDQGWGQFVRSLSDLWRLF